MDLGEGGCGEGCVLVHSGGQVAHERHEKERQLKDMVLDVVDAVNDFFVPGRLREIGE